MLSNCDQNNNKINITPISSTTNDQWPQIILDDHHDTLIMASSSSSLSSPSSAPNVMDQKTTSQQQQPAHDHPHQHHPLKCPRCDSSNTKFCYYNNYSLSQPRHFCKACKRYWTRGGTLRNVPVGGGCRKNKRVKRPQPSTGNDVISSAVSAGNANPNNAQPPRVDLSPNSSHVNSSLFYSHLTNPHELNFPFSSFRVSNSDHNGGFDHLNGLGLGFSPGLIASDHEIQNNDHNQYKNVNPLFSSAGNSSMFFGSSSFASHSTMASLLASGLQHQKFNGTMKDIQSSGNNNSIYPGLMPYEVTQMGKEMKMEGENRLDWNPDPNPVEQIHGSDPSSLVWNTTNLGAWCDPSNMGSSVPSLI